MLRRSHRIGYVVSQFPCYDETFILREIKALSERGVDIVIFSLRRRPQAVIQEEAHPFLAVTRYASYILSTKVWRAFARTAARKSSTLARLVVVLGRDLWRRPRTLVKSLAFVPKSVYFAELAAEEGIIRLHAHWATHPATAALLMSRLTGIPWSFTCHAHDIFFDPILLREKLESAEFALTCTTYNKRYLESLSSSAAEKVRVSYHGLDLELFRPPPERPRDSDLKILAVGSLLECKGFDDLIEACRILKQRGLRFRLTIAGGGPEEKQLRLLASQAGLEDLIHLAGFVTQNQLIPLYQGADLFVLPAVIEIHWGIPNVLVEALACGVPVVTTPLPSVTELVVDGVNGLITRDRDPAALAHAIERLAESPELRKDMGIEGRQRVEQLFNIDCTIETVLEPLIAK